MAGGSRETPVPVEKMMFESVVVNPKLDDMAFSKPDPNAQGTLSERLPSK